MRNTRIWILITDGVSARICSTKDGSTVAMTAPTKVWPGAIREPARQQMDEAWYLGRKSSFLRGATARFTDHIAQILSEAAAGQAFDGLVIIAAGKIASEIERSLSEHTRALMIGDVVRDLPAFAPAQADARMDLSH